MSARDCTRPVSRSTTIWEPSTASSAPSAERQVRKTVEGSASTTATPQGESGNSSATAATEGSDSATIIRIPSPRQPGTSERIASLPERSQLIIKWREEVLSYGSIAKELGISRQQTARLWEQAQTARPSICWCGEIIPLNTEGGRPKTYCKPEHRRPPGQPAVCWVCGTRTRYGGTKPYCKPAHRPYRRFPHLTQGDYDRMLREQNYVCATCKQPETMLNNQGRVRKLAVDHCRATNTIRGLLCSNCNIMLGFFDDNAVRLDYAAEYLQEHVA